MRLLRMIICLFRGHVKWRPDSKGTWDMVACKAKDGTIVSLNICARCYRLYSVVEKHDEF